MTQAMTFGRNRDQVWTELCRQIGGEFIHNGKYNGARVEAHVGPWTTTLDTHNVPRGEGHAVFTRLRAPYRNHDGFRFHVHTRTFKDSLKRLIGAQDIHTGHEVFDKHFVLQGNDPKEVRALFDDERLRELLLAQPAVSFSVKHDEGWFGVKFPDGVDELYFETPGVVRDVAQLRGMFDLFAETLHRLHEIGSADEVDPGVRV